MIKKSEQESERNFELPKRLIRFVDTPDFYNFLQALLEYCKELFRLENKQQVLEQEARQRGLPVPQVLLSEKKKLAEKAG